MPQASIVSSYMLKLLYFIWAWHLCSDLCVSSVSPYLCQADPPAHKHRPCTNTNTETLYWEFKAARRKLRQTEIMWWNSSFYCLYSSVNDMWDPCWQRDVCLLQHGHSGLFMRRHWRRLGTEVCEETRGQSSSQLIHISSCSCVSTNKVHNQSQLFSVVSSPCLTFMQPQNHMPATHLSEL